MKTLITVISMLVVFAAADAPKFYQFKMDNIEGESVALSKYAGKVVLVVNVASKCGLTPQYKDLQALYEKKSGEGLVILGFPANNFAGQEPGTEEEIQEFCSANYGVTFPMFSKISVKGDDMHPLYEFLTSKDENGVMDSDVKWNFQKYVIDRKGQLREMIPPRKSVLDEEPMAIIDRLLAEK